MKLIKYIGAVVLLLSMTTSCSEDKYGEHSGTEYRKQADEGMRKGNVIG